MTAVPSGRSRIPEFASIQEAAEFWDTHDLAEFEDELEEVEIEVARPLGHILGVRLDARTLTDLVRLARARGLGPSTLARMWLLERLAQEAPADASRTKPRRTRPTAAPAAAKPASKAKP